MSKPSRRNLSDSRSEIDASINKNKEYYLKNRDKLIAYAKEYRKTPEYKVRITEYKRQYHIKNRDKIIERTRNYYLTHKEERNKYRSEWQKANKDKMKIYRMKHKLRLKLETFDAYGGPICKCCGENEITFLTIDHINNNGNIERKSLNSRGGYSFYGYLRNNNFPSGYQVLCFNCNMAKGILGYCPHIPL